MMRFIALVPLLAACGTGAVVSLGSAELEAPSQLTVSPTALGYSRRAVVPVSSRGRTATTVEVSAAPPFSAPASLTVPGGVDAELEVTFTPVAVGVAQGELVVGGLTVSLSGEGVAVPECPAVGTCETSRFDPDTVACVVTSKDDGTACEDLLQCIEGGVCEAGRCRGLPARCDDGSACTTDACAVGLGCQHVAATCVAPVNPCLAARCDPSSGCATTPVTDGTPCGAVGCEVANVCLAGACREVTPPDGFTCTQASPCRGEGVCRARRCVEPA
ncbi:MAG: tenascin-X, partial [Myxococcaceae bacterium]|nr:tenascin-X [Myxococcaceae bacterium]